MQKNHVRVKQVGGDGMKVMLWGMVWGKGIQWGECKCGFQHLKTKLQELTILLKVEDLAMNAHVRMSMIICTSLGADVGK